MDLKSFQMLEFINSRLNNIEKNIARIDEKLDFSITLQRNHMATTSINLSSQNMRSYVATRYMYVSLYTS